MLRSFSYAMHAAARQHGPGSSESGTVPEPWLRAGNRALAGAFLGAYLDAASGATFLPESDAIDILLDAFVLHKAFYELGYELNNRPDWVAIPLQGMLALATRGTEPTGDRR